MISFCFFYRSRDHRDLHSFPTRRSSDLFGGEIVGGIVLQTGHLVAAGDVEDLDAVASHHFGVDTSIVDVLQHSLDLRSEEHTSELQSHSDLVCRLLLEKKNKHESILLLS